MRIVIWTDAFWPEIGGLEVFCMRLCTALQARGHTCLVVSNRPVEVPPEEFYRDVPVRRFGFHETLNRLDFRTFRIENESCARAVAEFAPDVIHLNSSSKSLLSFVLQQRSRRHPVLLTLHDRHLYRRTSVLAQEVFEQVDVIAAVSDYIHRDALTHMPQLGDKLHTVPNALPAPAITPLPLPDEPRLLAFGRLVKDKGFDLALLAFASVARSFPEATLTIAGDGPERLNLQILAQKLGLERSVHFPGWIAPDDISDLINRHSIVLMPSQWKEPFGLVALQAAQMGRPICAARSGGIPEIVVDGETGMLFESENVEALADNLRTLLQSPELCREMGRKAREHARENFDFDLFLARYEELYAQARAASSSRLS